MKWRVFNPLHSRWTWRVALLFLAGIALAVASGQLTDTPSNTPKKPKKQHQPMRKLRAMGEKVLTPNSKIQRPSATTMPVNAPLTPQLTPIPPAEPQPSGVERFFRGAAKVMTTSWDNNIFVWLPALSTDPNSGPTFGILPVLVLSEKEHHHIQHLLAPSYTYNETFGQTITGRYYFYPKDQSQLYANASYSTHTNRELKIRYEDAAFLGGRAFVRVESYYDVDGALRFFGIGPQTHEGDETGYTGHDKVAHFDMGVNFLENFRVFGGLRLRRLEVDPTIVSGIANTATVFPNLPGISEQNTVVQEAHMIWDTRDFPLTPTKGSSGEIFFETTNRGWGSDADYFRYGIEGKHFFPWTGGKQTTVIHGLYDWANGPNIPFYELATLGGRETLRGFGAGRFSDQGRILFNIEQRILLTSMNLMGVNTRFEVGPFFDMGTVFPDAESMQLKNLYPVYGGAFRAAVTPNVVGSVDVGVGKEGPGVFVGINYPF